MSNYGYKIYSGTSDPRTHKKFAGVNMINQQIKIHSKKVRGRNTLKKKNVKD